MSNQRSGSTFTGMNDWQRFFDAYADRYDGECFTRNTAAEVAFLRTHLQGASLQIRERGYTPTEIRRMLTWSGFTVKGVYGGTAGDWGFRPPRLDEMELLLLAERTASPA